MRSVASVKALSHYNFFFSTTRKSVSSDKKLSYICKVPGSTMQKDTRRPGYCFVLFSVRPAGVSKNTCNGQFIPLKFLTLRLLMSYIYIYMERTFLMFLDHTQRRSTVGRTPLDE